MLEESQREGEGDSTCTCSSLFMLHIKFLFNLYHCLSTPPALAEGLTCDQCNATFHDPQNYAAHMALHSSSLFSLSLARSAAVAAAAAASVAGASASAGAGAIGGTGAIGGADDARSSVSDAGRSEVCGENVQKPALASKPPAGDGIERGGAEGGRSIQGESFHFGNYFHFPLCCQVLCTSLIEYHLIQISDLIFSSKYKKNTLAILSIR